MSATMKELGIDRLSPEQQVALALEIWEYLGDPRPLAELTEVQQAELARRKAELEANHEITLSWEQIRSRVENKRLRILTRPLLILMCVAGISFFLPSCSSPQSEMKDPKVDDRVAQEKEIFVFRARYFQTKGPCIEIGGKLAMPVVDAFAVIEVIKGDLKVKSITVRSLTGGSSGYPKKLAEGKEYTLRLTPSERTKQQLGANEKDGSSWADIDGDEIEELKVGE